jgi:hypothetical protein
MSQQHCWPRGFESVPTTEVELSVAEPPRHGAPISVVGSTWTIEECGDHDPSGARVGAILQALIAREPLERRPTIRPGCRLASYLRRSRSCVQIVQRK